jgi:hypothetical protein
MSAEKGEGAGGARKRAPACVSRACPSISQRLERAMCSCSSHWLAAGAPPRLPAIAVAVAAAALVRMAGGASAGTRAWAWAWVQYVYDDYWHGYM